MCRVKSLLLAVALILSAAAALTGPAAAQTPLGTQFTYQGQLRMEGEPLNDSADFLFSLWDAESEGNMIGAELAAEGVSVVEGLFTAELDFGAAVFNGEARWLEIAVRSPAGEGEFTTLSPRQPLTATPYAIQTRGIFVNEAGDRVGIGTQSPGSSLEVNGGVRARGGPPGGFGVNNNGYAFSGNGGDNDSGLFSLANGQVSVYTDGAERFRFSSAGLRLPDGSTLRSAPTPAAVPLGAFSIPPNGRFTLGVRVNGATPGMGVIVNPRNRLLERNAISYAYVESQNIVVFEIINHSNIQANYSPSTWDFTLFQ
ncbi:MAG: hypothetical protein C4547_00260 [Phycisphaerales bacterium]|nr:MAG: hypothetical protein C4547_00260 [Phycisphaerales bacterium]